MIVTVVGNYPKIPNRPRPARLRNAYARLDRGEITWDEMTKVQDQVTIEVLKEQAEAGVELVTDGQIRWDGRADLPRRSALPASRSRA